MNGKPNTVVAHHMGYADCAYELRETHRSKQLPMFFCISIVLVNDTFFFNIPGMTTEAG